MYEDEKTIEQPVASEEEQTQPEGSEVGQSVVAEDENLVPEKFIDKSPAEIIQAYRELEKDRGRLASELGDSRKNQEELQEKFREVEKQSMQYQAPPTQTPPQSEAQPQSDPLERFRTRFDDDPKTAIEEALRMQQDALAQRTQQQSLQQRAAEASQYYWSQKRENPDYARREPMMQQLVSEYQDVIRPEYLNSSKVLKALDLMSKGMDLGYYSKQAVEQAQRDGLSVREEKRRAQSESSHSEGETRVSFDNLSLDQMEKMLKTDED